MRHHAEIGCLNRRRLAETLDDRERRPFGMTLPRFDNERRALLRTLSANVDEAMVVVRHIRIATIKAGEAQIIRARRDGFEDALCLAREAHHRVEALEEWSPRRQVISTEL